MLCVCVNRNIERVCNFKIYFNQMIKFNQMMHRCKQTITQTMELLALHIFSILILSLWQMVLAGVMVD